MIAGLDFLAIILQMKTAIALSCLMKLIMKSSLTSSLIVKSSGLAFLMMGISVTIPVTLMFTFKGEYSPFSI